MPVIDSAKQRWAREPIKAEDGQVGGACWRTWRATAVIGWGQQREKNDKAMQGDCVGSAWVWDLRRDPVMEYADEIHVMYTVYM